MKKKTQLDNHNRGFSLVELSIVLVIIGLLTGAILAGSALIRASEVRSIGDDYKRFTSATLAFRDKYSALPGDMANATQFWGVENATPAVCQTTASTTATTCNGSGDGYVCDASDQLCYEMHRYWQHLANAGLIAGKFTGVKTSVAGGGSTPGVNAPQLRLSQTTFQIRNRGTAPDTVNAYGGEFGHIYFFGRALDMNSDPIGAALTPQEAWNIDVKFDDGKPGTGKVTTVKAGATASYYSTVNNCAVGTNAATATYNVSEDSIACMLFLQITH